MAEAIFAVTLAAVVIVACAVPFVRGWRAEKARRAEALARLARLEDRP